jgi:hypothetical protein
MLKLLEEFVGESFKEVEGIERLLLMIGGGDDGM